MESPFAPDFCEFLSVLNSNGVEYLIVGGYAVAHYGHLRTTGDLDVWIAVDQKNAERVRAALAKFGFPAGSTTPEDFTRPNGILRMGVPPVRIEILNGISGVNFASCYANRVAAKFGGVPANVISRDDLLANKRAAGRHKDLDDVENLIRIAAKKPRT